MGMVMEITTGFVVLLFLSLLVLLAALISYFMMHTPYYITHTAPELMPEESIKKQSWALYTFKYDMIKGRLFLTNQRWIFLASPFSFSNKQISIALTDVNIIKPALIIWLFKNGLQITTKQGEQFEFGLFNWRDWQKIIID
jgi:hypothetical protein